MDNKKTAHFKGLDSVKVLPVIETRTTIGTGTDTDLLGTTDTTEKGA